MKALEREANVLASELLMPELEVRQSYDGLLADVATVFGVSPEAMSWRLHNLWMVDDHP